MEETRKLKIIKNKDGHGTMGYKIALPSKWIEIMGLDKTDYATLIFKDNSITIKNKEEKNMKLVKGNLGFYEFGEYVRKFEEKILNTDGVVNLLMSDMDEEIPFSGGVFRREYCGKGRRGGTKIKKDLLYTKTPDNIYEIYEYEE